ncbi:cytochrome P450 [Nocardia sp. NPDC050799]|uniref:cytochrome P450 n=1 Tax=Nocardia sp. NPDC050799 TaxID=3154842 RepID=UPI003404E1C1
MTAHQNTEARESLPAFPSPRADKCPFDPPPAFEEHRENAGITEIRLWNNQTAWLITRADYFRALLNDPRVSADRSRPGMPMTSKSSTAKLPTRASFRMMDGEEHRRLRRMVTRDFSMPSVEASREQIQQICGELIDEMIAKGPTAELIRDYAFGLPTQLICHILGISTDQRDFLETQVATMFNRDTDADIAEAAGRALVDYLRTLIEEVGGQEPRDNVVSRLVHRQYRQDKIDLPDLLNTLVQLIAGGFDTTGNGIGSSVHLLLQHPDRLAALRDSDDPRFIAGAIEELLRYIPIIDSGFDRVAGADIDLDGHLIKAGQGLIFNVPAANRDPRDFDAPGELDLCRDARAHVAFGYGPHQCLGQNLARVEMQVAVPALLRRLPGLAHAVPVDRIEWRFDRQIIGLDALPVTWDQEAALALQRSR